MSSPKVGDIWLDTHGDHNLVMRIHKDEYGDEVVHVLTLDTGREWTECPLEQFADGEYFYKCVA